MLVRQSCSFVHVANRLESESFFESGDLLELKQIMTNSLSTKVTLCKQRVPSAGNVPRAWLEGGASPADILLRPDSMGWTFSTDHLGTISLRD
jgi:hypothetical protein